MSGNPVPLETVTRVTPLGVRFRDAATGVVVSDGLRVRERGHGVEAVPNRAGVWIAAGLAGLHTQEHGSGDERYWSTVVRRAYEFEVEDRLGRFAGFRFTADLPHRGPLALDCLQDGSPPLDALPLYATAGRVASAGMAVVRAELWDETAGAPAAHAILEAGPAGGPPALGLADAEGRAAVVLPYPEPPGDGLSPSETPPLAQQTWPLDVAVRYARGPAHPSGLPDLCAALGQPHRALLASLAPRTALTGATLEYGRELVLRTAGRATVVVTPAI